MNLPDKFTIRMKRLLGSEYEDYYDSFNDERLYGLRVNTLKIEPEEFRRISNLELVEIPWTDNGFYYKGSEAPAKHPFYHGGLYYIQEPSAMLPAAMLPINEGDKVLDICAAPGGKSTELGAKLKESGILVSNDISSTRAKALLKNIELLGIRNGIVISEDPKKLVNYFEGYFDKILVDAPCSGEGMFRKDISITKNWEQYGVEYYNRLQKDIIIYASKMLKPDGYMLYSTCTFSPEENEGTIAHLLNSDNSFKVEKLPKYEGFHRGRPEWLKEMCPNIQINDSLAEQLNNCIRLWPHRIKGEGHFVALLKKDKNASTYSFKEHKIVKRKDISELVNFIEGTNLKLKKENIEVHEEKAYYMPEGLADIKGLRILRSGLYLGDIKKNRFEPSQALAAAIKISEYNEEHIINFSSESEEVVRYLKCETLELKEDYSNGLKLICVDGYPLGWGKFTHPMLKNKYFSGWRWM